MTLERAIPLAILKTARALTRPRGFESHTLRSVISQDIEDTLNPHWVRKLPGDK